MPVEWKKAYVIKIKEVFSQVQEIFVKIKENSLSPKNTGGNADFTGVTGDYRRSCHACNHCVLVACLPVVSRGSQVWLWTPPVERG